MFDNRSTVVVPIPRSRARRSMAGSTGSSSRSRTGDGDGGGSGGGSYSTDVLMSLETMDRASPDLWPQHMSVMEPEESEYIQCNGSASHSTVPGLGDFVALRSESTSRDKKPSSSWNKLTTPSDIRLMHQLSTLSTSSLIIEVKKLHDLAYQLGIEESKEMTRGKYLNIFKSRCNR